MKSKIGFTLIELIIAMLILATILLVVLLVVAPATQIKKANDARREQTISQIKNALDIYYSDKNCYPAQNSAFTTALTSGTTWTEGTTIYMKTVPLDDAGHAFRYLVESTSCPQWAVVFAKLNKASAINNICSLGKITEQDCTPTGYDASWACTVLGALGAAGCSQVAASTINY